ncbi:MAG: hydroxymethylbilane synthase, partial [Myxococcota bacterium]|nr:hydroxymethylbilane synthase [Myxococcota bacterium]
MKSLILGTRGSLLAKAQSQQVANALSAKTGIPVVLKIIKTRGDAIQDKPLAEIGGKGLFTLELEEALHDGTIDFAVHSLKDLPTDDPDGLMIGAIPKREDPRDALIGQLLGKIGTGSLRR